MAAEDVAHDVMDLVRRAQEAADRAGAERADAAQRIAAGDYGGLCPDDPSACGGQLRGGAQCPASVCPHASARAERDTAAWLRYCGFHEEALAPRRELLPAEIRRGVGLYVDTLPDRLVAGEGLTIGGTVGAGKTCALAVIAVGARESGVLDVEYVEAAALFNAFRDRDRCRVAMDAATHADLLLLDDIGTEDRAFGVLSKLHEILNHRWGNRRPTVITTNLSRDAMVRDQDLERIIDRIESRNPWLWTGANSQRPKASIAAWAAQQQGQEAEHGLRA